MVAESSALIVSSSGLSHLALRKALNEAGLHVRLAGSCSEARGILEGSSAPAVMFSDALLPDGTWLDILDLAMECEHEVPVIFIPRIVDPNVYLNGLEEGAADFIIPSFYHQFTHIESCHADLHGSPGAWRPMLPC